MLGVKGENVNCVVTKKEGNVITMGRDIKD
jgi:hypothetical protein